MNKEFNVTGTCIPEMHYMVDTSYKIDQVIELYEQLIYEHMTMKIIRKDKSSSMSHYNYKQNFITSEGNLDILKVLTRFQDFMKHEYSEKSKAFLEEDGAC